MKKKIDNENRISQEEFVRMMKFYDIETSRCMKNYLVKKDVIKIIKKYDFYATSNLPKLITIQPTKYSKKDCVEIKELVNTFYIFPNAPKLINLKHIQNIIDFQDMYYMDSDYANLSFLYNFWKHYNKICGYCGTTIKNLNELISDI